MATIQLNEYAASFIYDGLLAEKLMQYCNRYRRNYPEINEPLFQAEIAFRAYDYRKSKEMVKSILGAIEMEAIHKIEKTIVIEDVLQGLKVENDCQPQPV